MVDFKLNNDGDDDEEDKEGAHQKRLSDGTNCVASYKLSYAGCRHSGLQASLDASKSILIRR